MIFSLDFELLWGQPEHLWKRERLEPELAERLRRCPELVLRLGERAEQLGLVLSWAVVGGLACSGLEEAAGLCGLSPAHRRALHWAQAQPERRAYFLAAECVQELRARPGQVLGFHGLSHRPHGECPVPPSVFHEELRESRRLLGLASGGFWVPPRHQELDSDPQVLLAAGISVQRALPSGFWSREPKKQAALWRRAGRYWETYSPLGGPQLRGLGARRSSAQELTQVVAQHYARAQGPGLGLELQLERLRALGRRLPAGQSLHSWTHPEAWAGPYEPGLFGFLEGLARLGETFQLEPRGL